MLRRAILTLGAESSHRHQAWNELRKPRQSTAIRRTKEEEGDDQRLHPPNPRDVSLSTLERCRRKIGRQAAAHSCVPGCQPRSRERGKIHGQQDSAATAAAE
jgi:hypothetical protein